MPHAPFQQKDSPSRLLGRQEIDRKWWHASGRRSEGLPGRPDRGPRLQWHA